MLVLMSFDAAWVQRVLSFFVFVKLVGEDIFVNSFICLFFLFKKLVI